MTSNYQLPQYELTPIPGYQPDNSGAATATGNVGAGVPQLPDYGQIDDVIAQINATNQAAQHQANLGRIPGAEGLEQQSSRAIADLFDPDANLPSVNMDAAAAAVGSGTVGSPFAGVSGLHRRDDEITRRQTLAQQMLSSAYGRNPSAAIADPQALLTLLQSEGFQAGQSAAQRALQLRLQQMQNENALAIAALRNSGAYGSHGPGSYGPNIPRNYGPAGTTAPPATYRSNIPDTGGTSSSGGGVGVLLPTNAVPDNFYDLTGAQQMDYANQWWNNPYAQMPEVLNPYDAGYNPLDPSLTSYYE